MNKKIRLQISNLAKFIFEDIEYNKFMYYITNEKYNDARLLVDEKFELLSMLQNIDNSTVIESQINYCNELEDIVIDFCLIAK